MSRNAGAPRAYLTRREVLARAYRKWNDDEAVRLAAALSYYTAFSIGPVILLTAAVVGLVFGDAIRVEVTRKVATLFGSQQAAALDALLRAAQRPHAGKVAGWLGFVSLLWGAASVVGELQATLNRVYGVTPAARTVWEELRRRFISLGFVFGMGFLLLVSLLLGVVSAAAGRFFGAALGVGELFIHVLNQGASFAVISLLFTCMFRFLPDARVAWRDLWVGGTATALMFVAGNVLLSLYLGKVATTTTYGAAGSLLAFLLWTYYCAQIFYFGAEFTVAFAQGRGSGVHPKTAGEAHAVRGASRSEASTPR